MLFGRILGIISGILFFYVGIPRIIKNYKKKSVLSESLTDVIINILYYLVFLRFGICFNFEFPFIIGIFLQFCIYYVLIFQFCIYSSYKYFFFNLLLLILFVPLKSSVFYFIIVLELVSLVHFMYFFIKSKSTLEISLFGEHISFIGGIYGFYSCAVSTDGINNGWVFYSYFIFRSAFVIFASIYYNEYRIYEDISSTKIQTIY